MSDDLVEMARLAQHDERMATGALYGDLADRIEELEALRDALGDKVRKLTTLLDDQFGTPCEQIRHKQEVEELEAKVAKAVEVLGLIVTDDTWGLEHETYLKCKTTLAELKGEDRG